MLDEPLEAPLEAGQPIEHLRLERLHRKQRNQPDHRPHLQREPRPVVEPQAVVEEPVLVVPEIEALVLALMAHRVADVDEVLPELAGEVFVRGVVVRQLHRHRQQVQRVHRHPAGRIGLLQRAAGRQRLRAVEHADVVQAEEAAFEDVAARGVLAVDPPREVEQQLLEHAFEELAVADAAALLLDLVDAPRRPRVHRRVHVAKRPLVRGQLPVGVHVPLAQHQRELVLGELGVDQRQRHHVKRQVPRGVPRVLPLVRHRDDVGVEQVRPLVVAPVLALGRRRRLARIAVEPALHDVVVVLLGPEHPGQALAHHGSPVLAERLRNDARVELVGLGPAARNHVVDAGAGDLGGVLRGEAHFHRRRAAGGDQQLVVRGRLGADAGRVHRLGTPVDDGVVDAVLEVLDRARPRRTGA